MTRLDCHDLNTALASVGAGIGRRTDDVRAALLSYDEERFSDCSEDPWHKMPRELLASLGVDPQIRVESACFFHGSRVPDPAVFWREGILPLDQVLERIWTTLFELIDDDIAAEEWDAFRRSIESGAGDHDGWLYRLKTRGRMHYGPQALLVREIFLDPATTRSHDYVGCPEIVQDIARCFQTVHGVDLEALFCASTAPVIVKFTSSSVREDLLRAALWYAYSGLRGDEITREWDARGGFDGAGSAVGPRAVVDVELRA